MLQPFHYDPSEKNRHKFLVQTLVVPDGITEIQESLVCNFFINLFDRISLLHLFNYAC